MRFNHTTSFIVDGIDHFTANLDNGGVRVGMVGGNAYDLPVGDVFYGQAVAAKTESEVETIFDQLCSKYL